LPNYDLLLAIMAFFVFLSAVALAVQAVMLIGMWKSTKALQEQVTAVLPLLRSVLGKADVMLDENRKNIADATQKAREIAVQASEIMEMGKAQMAKIDLVITDATDRAKVQLERAEMVVDDTMTRVHESVAAVHNGVLAPVREIQGLLAGLSAMTQHLLRGGRPSVADATHDDEMFIG